MKRRAGETAPALMNTIKVNYNTWGLPGCPLNQDDGTERQTPGSLTFAVSAVDAFLAALDIHQRSLSAFGAQISDLTEG